MSEKRLTNIVVEKFNKLLDDFKANPNKMTDDDRSALENIYSSLCKTMGISEHSQWRVNWEVSKWADTARFLSGCKPDEVIYDTQNIILDVGANEMLKLISGTGGTPFSNTNAYIYVGSDSSPENAAQTGVLATGNNRAYAKLNAGSPAVVGRQVEYEATFADEEANFAWNEVSIVNGIGTNAVSMNRKVKAMGTKVTGTWGVKVTISLTST